MSNNVIWPVLVGGNYSMIASPSDGFAIMAFLRGLPPLRFWQIFRLSRLLSCLVLLQPLRTSYTAPHFLQLIFLASVTARKKLKTGVKIGIFSIVATTLIMQICLWFAPHASDTSSAALSAIFSLMPRISLASITATWLVRILMCGFFNHLRCKYPDKLWLRNNLATMGPAS